MDVDIEISLIDYFLSNELLYDILQSYDALQVRLYTEHNKTLEMPQHKINVLHN